MRWSSCPLELHRDGRIAGGELQPLPRYLDEAAAQVFPRLVEGRQVRHRLAAADEWALQGPVVRRGYRDALRRHDLLGCGTGGLVPANRGLAAADGLLVLGPFDHSAALDLDQFVDEAGRR